jgi:hypothetical protein
MMTVAEGRAIRDATDWYLNHSDFMQAFVQEVSEAGMALEPDRPASHMAAASGNNPWSCRGVIGQHGPHAGPIYSQRPLNSDVPHQNFPSLDLEQSLGNGGSCGEERISGIMHASRVRICAVMGGSLIGESLSLWARSSGCLHGSCKGRKAAEHASLRFCTWVLTRADLTHIEFFLTDRLDRQVRCWNRLVDWYTPHTGRGRL